MINLLTKKVTWKRPNMTADRSAKDYADGYTVQEAGLRCFLHPVKAEVWTAYFQRGEEVSHTMITDQVRDYQVNDRFFLGTREFRVKGVRNLAEMDRVISIDCMEEPGTAKRN